MRCFRSPGVPLLFFGLALLPSQTAQAQDTEMFATGPVNASFVPVPGFPKGADFYVVHGNPMEAFEMYFRLLPGVRVPTVTRSPRRSTPLEKRTCPEQPTRSIRASSLSTTAFPL